MIELCPYVIRAPFPLNLLRLLIFFPSPLNLPSSSFRFYFFPQEVADIWASVVGPRINAELDDFIEMNRQLDDLFEMEEDEATGAIILSEADLQQEQDQHRFALTGPSASGALTAPLATGVGVDDAREMDVWSPSLDPGSLLEPEFVRYLREYFQENVTPDGLAFPSFFGWKDVVSMLEKGNIDLSCLKDVWAEAVMNQEAKGSAQSQSAAGRGSSDNDRAATDKKIISFDTFLRMNMRLENVMDEIESALETLTDEDIEEYYRSEFTAMADGGHLLCYSDFAGETRAIIVHRTIRACSCAGSMPCSPSPPFHSYQHQRRRAPASWCRLAFKFTTEFLPPPSFSHTGMSTLLPFWE